MLSYRCAAKPWACNSCRTKGSMSSASSLHTRHKTQCCDIAAMLITVCICKQHSYKQHARGVSDAGVHL